MRLYQHSSRCPVALRSFLDCNPTYWCFVPLLCNEAMDENITHPQESPDIDPELHNVIMMDAHVDARVTLKVEHVPIPPATYAFSYRQRELQRFFFETLTSPSMRPLPYSTLDLYKVTIIAVRKSTDLNQLSLYSYTELVPDDCSKILRYIIETLFIAHGEPKLNMLHPLGIDPTQKHGHVTDQVWCANFNRRPISSSASNQK
jgi:hypothetical protein